MSTIKADTVQPADSEDITLGATGDTVTVAANSINVDKVQDKGGNTLWDYSTGEFVAGNKTFGSQSLVLISDVDCAGLDDVTFTFSSTYQVYKFNFITMRPATNSTFWRFQCNKTPFGLYNTTLQSTFFVADHTENGTTAAIAYTASGDQQNGTAYERTNQGTGTGSNQACSGELWIFAPQSPTFVKQWYCRINDRNAGSPPQCSDNYSSGYFNTTDPLHSINFKWSSGGITAGTVRMFGLL